MSSHKKAFNPTSRATGKRKERSKQHSTIATRKSRRLLEKTMRTLNIDRGNEAAAFSGNVEEEDITMVDSVAVTHEEDLDTEPSKHQIHFPVNQDRLNQPEDGIDESEDKDNIAPMIPQVAKKKRIMKVVKNPRGKYVNYEADLLRDRALKLLGYRWTLKDIERRLDIPTSTMSDHYKRYRTRGGNTAPIKQKGPKLSKISQDSSKFLVKTVLEKENTATLQQLVRAYYMQFQIILQPSTIYRHLVKKCEITIKRAHVAGVDVFILNL
ncbi:hypothetical protein BDC45DRAFT_535053 [Circinella umbellata]|nr:hypothetical protein BDC45DRAFT_535053 [Circinella umbellata]